MLGSPILYLKGMRILMFQLSGIYYKMSELQGCANFANENAKSCPKGGVEQNDHCLDHRKSCPHDCTGSKASDRGNGLRLVCPVNSSGSAVYRPSCPDMVVSENRGP